MTKHVFFIFNNNDNYRIISNFINICRSINISIPITASVLRDLFSVSSCEIFRSFIFMYPSF